MCSVLPIATETHKQEECEFSLWIRKDSSLQRYSFLIKIHTTFSVAREYQIC